ncbi:hypothetical protein ACFQXB_09010 [Plastorhodobacter daqingensis]|uniref:Clp protease n=1 Tax=Plastorhodobacter daqingensis TaxID=1387281 RepID=A0ABW2UM90_9RHOB
MSGAFRIGAAQGIRLMLLAQIAIGALLLSGDLLGPGGPRWPWAERAPALDQPVRPGDQTRRYRPDRAPPSPFRAPGAADMPRRLAFEPAEDGLRLRGQIAPGDAERFLAHLEGLEAPPTTLWLASPGGSVADALEIGQILRARGLATAVAAGDICLSACPYVLAAGTSRAAAEGAMIGVHQHYFGENTLLPAFLAVEDIQRGQGEVMGYLEEMGIDLRLMRHALLTPPDEIYILLPEELATYRLVTPPPGVPAGTSGG